MKKLYNLFIIFISILSVIFLNACRINIKNNDIVILYTNDIHCAIDENIGYSSLKAFKNEIKTKTDYVTLVDLGDAIQGSFVGSVSNGEYIVEIMNECEYDMFVLGNHEFDYGMDKLSDNLKAFKGTTLACNFKYTGSGEDKFGMVEPYKIIEYGNKKIGYIGVATPDSITSSTPEYFMEDNELVYSFTGEYETNETNFYKLVQDTIDEVHTYNVDYCILLTHLGDKKTFAPYDSISLISNTSGVDAVLDGHAHSEIASKDIKNKDGKKVTLSSAGTKLNKIGELVISSDGKIKTDLVSKYNKKDSKVDSFIESIMSQYEEQLNTVISHTNYDLKIKDALGLRLVRQRETNLGDLIADAYRIMTGADVGIQNGGGVRTDIKKGNITYKNVYDVLPFGNQIIVVNVTGQQILDILEFSVKDVTRDYVLNFSEFGGFLQVSGLTFDVNTSVKSPVVLNNDKTFKKIEGNRRISNVKVLENDSYVDLDINKTYTLAGNNYSILEGGDGNTILSGVKKANSFNQIDYQVLIDYIQSLKSLNEYKDEQDRINIK